MTPILQVALDEVELARAVQIAREAVDGGADYVEAGTPLIKSEGMDAVRTLKKAFPGHAIVADMKTMDTGAIEVEMAAKAGAAIVSILGASADATISDALRSARKYGVRLSVDLINVPEPAARAARLQEMGVDMIGVHVGIDQQMTGQDPLDVLRKVRGAVSVPIAAAGGLDARRAAAAVALGADIVIVGGNIIRSKDVTGATRAVREAIDHRMAVEEIEGKGSLDQEIHDLFLKVSTPNISDAMHRHPALRDIRPVWEGIKI
ncbi:MAG TPA: 3-hexulose-6-phosphate synthase, partial [Methanocella sp.]|nr:3-hexulose-6-phosphate synthase [Methanocella sp.]